VLSALGEHRTTLIDNFNNPSFLDFSIDLSWTPTSRLFVVLHSGNYNAIFSNSESSFALLLGQKWLQTIQLLTIK
jgi:hypothetical protein